MPALPLNYIAPLKTGLRRRLWRAVLVAIGLLFLFFVLPSVTSRQYEMRIDPITGSMNYRTIWWPGITTGEHTDISPLESRLNRSRIAWTRSWQDLTIIDYRLFSAARGCSPAPPIYQLRPMLKEFADASSDRELQDFVHMMQSGTPAAQTAVVDAAGNKAMQFLEQR